MRQRVGFPGVSIENLYNFRDDLPGLKIIEVTPKDIEEGDIDGKHIADINESAIALALIRVFNDVDMATCTADGKKFNILYTLTARLEVNGNYRGSPFLMMWWYHKDTDRYVLSYREPLKAVYNHNDHTYKYSDHKGNTDYLSNKKEYR